MPVQSSGGYYLIITTFVLFFSCNFSEAKLDLFVEGAERNDNFEYTLKSGGNVSIVCKGNSRIKWSTPEVEDAEYLNYTKITVSSPPSPSGIHDNISKLEIINITYPYVGYYRCFEEEIEDNSERIYLYVSDDDHLAVLRSTYRHIISRKNSRTVVPCRPTSPDVNVTLRSIGRGRLFVGDPILIEDCRNSFDYDPHEGFITEAFFEAMCDFNCVFSRRGMKDFKRLIYLEIQRPQIVLAEPSITTTKRNFVVGDTIILNCFVACDISAELTWRYPNQKRVSAYVSPGKMVTEGFISSLNITNITMEDTGEYQCIAKDSQNHVTLSNITLNVHDVDHFVIFDTPNSDSKVSVGESFTWNESFEAYPECIVEWWDNRNNSIKDHYNEKIKITISESHASLIFTDISYREHGVYTLKVNDGKEYKIKENFLNVTGKPEISLTLERFQLPNGKTTIVCGVISNPESDILLEYKPCVNDTCGYRKLDPESTRKGLLVRKTVTVALNESSTVKCNSINTEGYTEVEEKVYISDIPNGFNVAVDTTSIYFDEGKKNATVASSETINLTCGAFIDNPHQRLEWRKGSEKIIENGTYLLRQYETNYGSKKVSLIINEIKEGGNYSCILDSLGNITKKETIQIDVFEPLAPVGMWNSTESTMKKNLHDLVEFSCETYGLPKPIIQWFKDDQALNSDENVHFNDSKMKLMRIELEDEGVYRCVAKNNMGKSERIVTLEIRDKPSSKAFLWIIIIILLILVIIAIVYVNELRKRKLEKLLKQVGLLYFEQGKLDDLNPELGLEEQVDSLPYDKSWEFPPENLKIGKPLGSGAFGVVMKGEAKGISAGEERTTVAVKMVKKDAGYTYLKALASELKIMSHLGSHLNVVNLLGACTRDVAKGQLFVIVEFCKFGNTHNYLYRHRNDFIDQIDRNTGNIDFDVGNERLERSYSVASSRSFFPMKYVTQLSTRSNSCVKYAPNAEDKSTGDLEECKAICYSPRNEEGTKNCSGEDEILLSNNSSSEPDWRTNYSGDYRGTVRPICTKDLLIWAYQVAKGMDYLASRKVLHGDLAARNILLTDDNIVKICDFGLAKSIYKDDNYKKNSNCPLPFKWMAVESISDRIFSTQSDVWSYGIVLWEFFSLAKTPYPGMQADEKLYTKLLEGYRMEAPEYATNAIYQIMLECWAHNPLSRPSFSCLEDRLGKIIGEQMRQYYIDLNDPHLKCNIKRRESGIDDYLDKVSSPNFENLSTPLYTNQMESSPGYLSMKSPGINSPRPEDNRMFNFEPRVEKKSAALSLQDDVFIEEDEKIEENHETIPEVKDQQDPCDDGNSFSNPSYIYPPPKVENDKRDSDIQKTSDNYILMAKARSSDLYLKNEEAREQVLYINDLPQV